MLRLLRAPFVRYAVAIAVVFLATWMRMLLTDAIGDRAPTALLYLAIMFTAWYGGIGPSLVSLVLGILLTTHYIVPPHNSLLTDDPADILAISIYFFVGVVSIVLCESLRRTEARASQLAAETGLLNAQLRDADRRKDEFLAMLAHELRNPLAPIRTGIDLLSAAPGDREVTERTREMMARQVAQMIRLVNDLLDVSRILKGKIDLRKEPIRLSDAVDLAVETVEPLIKSRQHLLSVDLPDEPIWLKADLVRIGQVIGNLLNNAAKYTDPGGHIRLTAEKQNGWVGLRVVDNGVGIAADMLPRVFELFTQADNALQRAEGGMGIGLTLVRDLVEMHGGSVSIRSEGLGKGTEIVIRLPALSCDESVPPHSEVDGETGRPACAAESAPSRRVLVADDNHEAAETLAMLLRLQGHEVETAYDGIQAVEVAEDFRPGVILLDLGLPRVDGFEVARTLRARGEFRDTVIAALTGWGRDEDRARSREAGCDLHLVKPINVTILDDVLNHPRLAGQPR